MTDMATDPAVQALVEQNAKLLDVLTQLVQNTARPPEQNVHEAMASRMEQIRGGASLKVVTMLEQCTSPDTGSTFDVEMQDGKVVALRNYREPEKASIHKSLGGMYEGEIIVPGEVDRTGRPKMNSRFLTWRWQNFFQADLARFVGKPCPKYLSETSKPAPVAKTA
jgi:hypothetical protein